MKNFLTILSIIIYSNISAQNLNRYQFTQRVNLRIGGGFDFQNGANYDEIFGSNKSSLFSEGFLGYRFDVKNESANYFGLFGYIGQINIGALNSIYNDEVIYIPDTYTGEKPFMYEIESGIILSDWFRISAGKGGYDLPLLGRLQKVKYYSATSSIIFGKKLINFNIKNSVQFGDDLQRSTFRIGAGLNLNFNFIKTRKLYN